ncbi:MAG TPA: ATP-binding cassette domain-containing protein [Acidimicrobiia bacterium]|nr:ATP-binding cassette domain-containing protein [Acidimicrobiia bacterium]
MSSPATGTAATGAADANLPVIEVEHLTKRYSSDVLAVDDLGFQVARGEVCGLLGPNGAGKTTTLRMLVGLIRPTSGATRIFGTEIHPSSPVLARVGTMIEHAAFVPYLTGMVNLRLYWEAGGGDFGDANLDEALAIADLGTAIDRKVKTYSQGMRQRLGIARALLGRPEVLILDEPTNGLDPGEMREVRDLLRRLADRGATVLLSSHLLSEVEQVCSHAVVMDRGRLVAAGLVADLVQASTSAYFEVDDAARAEEVIRAMAGVRGVRPEQPGLSVDLDGARRSDVVAALVHAGIAVETVQSRHRLEDAFLGLLAEEG